MARSASMPHSREAEEAVLAWALVEPGWVPYAALHLQASDYYLEPHQILHEVLVGLQGKRDGVELAVVCDELGRRGQLEALGGASGLAELSDRMPVTTPEAERAVERVRALARVRRVMAAAREVDARARTKLGDVDEFIEWVERTVYEALHDRSEVPQVQPIAAGLREVVAWLEDAVGRGVQVTGVPTDFTPLDHLTGGWYPGIHLLAARPAMGKSALAAAALWRAGRAGIPALMFSLEMSRTQLYVRMLAAKAGVNGRDVMRADITQRQLGRIYGAATRLSDAPLWFCHDPRLSVEKLASLARLHKVRHGLGFVVVDYIGLLRTSRRYFKREQEVSDISKALKACAEELGVPVLALSQLNRDVERRPDKRPILADLRDSGALEQDADMVLFLYRDEVYTPDTKDRGIAEVRVAKNRNGPTGTARLRWVQEFTRFEEIEHVREPEQEPLAY